MREVGLEGTIAAKAGRVRKVRATNLFTPFKTKRAFEEISAEIKRDRY